MENADAKSIVHIVNSISSLFVSVVHKNVVIDGSGDDGVGGEVKIDDNYYDDKLNTHECSTLHIDSTSYDNSTLHIDSTAYDNSTINIDSTAYDNSTININSTAYGNSTINIDSTAYDNSTVYDYIDS